MDTRDEPMAVTPVGAPGTGAVVGTAAGHFETAADITAHDYGHPGGAGTAYTELMFRVNEMFGPTIQGEGPASGRHCIFLRLALCNLACRWCDTAYTWAHTPELAAHLDRPQVYDRDANVKTMGVHEVLDSLSDLWPLRERPTTVVVSGGEPLMQQPALIELARHLVAMGCAVHIETAGTIAPLPALADLVELFVVSPKLAHSGNHETKRIKPVALMRFGELRHRAMFKFVVTDVYDLPEVDALVAEIGLPACRVQVMPEGTTTGSLAVIGREIADEVTARGWGMSLRSHIVLWSDERGR